MSILDTESEHRASAEGDQLFYRSKLVFPLMIYGEQWGGRVKFTGWKTEIDWDQLRSLPEKGYVSQFAYVRLTGEKSRALFFVNLPGLQSGWVDRGGTFDIGTDRVFPSISDGDLCVMLVRGYLRFVAGVRERYPEEFTGGQ